MIGVLLNLSVKKDRLEEFIDMMKSIIGETRAYTGCQKFDIWIDKETTGRVVMNEVWESPELHQAYLAWRTETGVFEKLVEFLEEPPTPKYYEIVF